MPCFLVINRSANAEKRVAVQRQSIKRAFCSRAGRSGGGRRRWDFPRSEEKCAHQSIPIQFTPLYTAFVANRDRYLRYLRSLSGAPMAIVVLAVACGVGAQGQEQKPLDAADLADGMRLFQQKGNCQACHGWAGDGRKTDSQMPDGANLRETKLNRAGLVLTIKCGHLNSQMPAFDKFAYSDGRCYGKKLADLKSYPTRMPDPPATLQQREIELIADFLLAKVVGKGPMDHAKCVEFWGSETDACKEFPK